MDIESCLNNVRVLDWNQFEQWKEGSYPLEPTGIYYVIKSFPEGHGNKDFEVAIHAKWVELSDDGPVAGMQRGEMTFTPNSDKLTPLELDEVYVLGFNPIRTTFLVDKVVYVLWGTCLIYEGYVWRLETNPRSREREYFRNEEFNRKRG